MYQWAAEEAQKTSGGVAFFTSQMSTFDTPAHTEAPIEFLMNYIMAFDWEIFYRGKHNEMFFGGGDNSQHRKRIVELEKTRRDDIALLHRFRQLEVELAAKQRQSQSDEEAKVAEAERLEGWKNRRSVGVPHLREHCGYKVGTPDISARYEDAISSQAVAAN